MHDLDHKNMYSLLNRVVRADDFEIAVWNFESSRYVEFDRFTEERLPDKLFHAVGTDDVVGLFQIFFNELKECNRELNGFVFCIYEIHDGSDIWIRSERSVNVVDVERELVEVVGISGTHDLDLIVVVFTEDASDAFVLSSYEVKGVWFLQGYKSVA